MYSSVDAGSRGGAVSALVPLLCASFGIAVLRRPRGEGRDQKMVMTCMLMIGVCVMYGCVGALIIPTNAPGYAGLAAGLVNGLSAGLTAVSVGVFGARAAECCYKQRRLFVGGLLILIFMMSVALYALIVALVISATAKKTQVDMAPGAAPLFASIDVFANSGALLAIVASGISVMEVGVESPHCVMRSMIPVLFGVVIGIYGMMNAVVDTKSWPPTGGDALAGPLYAVSCVGVAYVGHLGVKRVPQDPRSFNDMVIKLIACESIGLAGLIIALVSSGMQQQQQQLRHHGPLSLVAEVLPGCDPSVLAASAVAVVLLFVPLLGVRLRSGRPLDVPLLA